MGDAGTRKVVGKLAAEPLGGGTFPHTVDAICSDLVKDLFV
jgi:hypothetical protein